LGQTLVEPEHASPGVVDHDVDAAQRLGGGSDPALDARVARNVHLDDGATEFPESGGTLLVSSARIAENGGHEGAPPSQFLDSQFAESSTCPTNDDLEDEILGITPE
jgi:hypothetical protein